MLSLVLVSGMALRCLSTRSTEVSSDRETNENPIEVTSKVSDPSPGDAPQKLPVSTTPNPLSTPPSSGDREKDGIRFFHWLRDAKDRMTSDFVLRYLESDDSTERKAAVLETFLESNPKSFYPQEKWRSVILKLFREGKTGDGLGARCATVLRYVVQEKPSEAIVLEENLREQHWPDREQGALIFAIGKEALLLEYGKDAPAGSFTRGYAVEGLERIGAVSSLWTMVESNSDSDSRNRTILAIGRKIQSPQQARDYYKKIENLDPEKQEQLKTQLFNGLAQSNSPGKTLILLSEFEEYLERCRGVEIEKTVPGGVNEPLLAESYWSERAQGHDMKSVEDRISALASQMDDIVTRHPDIDNRDINIAIFIGRLSENEHLSACNRFLKDKCKNDPFRLNLQEKYEPYFKKRQSQISR